MKAIFTVAVVCCFIICESKNLQSLVDIKFDDKTDLIEESKRIDEFENYQSEEDALASYRLSNSTDDVTYTYEESTKIPISDSNTDSVATLTNSSGTQSSPSWTLQNILPIGSIETKKNFGFFINAGHFLRPFFSKFQFQLGTVPNYYNHPYYTYFNRFPDLLRLPMRVLERMLKKYSDFIGGDQGNYYYRYPPYRNSVKR